MKQVVWSGRKNGKKVSGSWFCEERPNRAQTIAEWFAKGRLEFFRFVVREVKSAKAGKKND